MRISRSLSKLVERMGSKLMTRNQDKCQTYKIRELIITTEEGKMQIGMSTQFHLSQH